MKLLHEEYSSLDQLLEECPLGVALDLAAPYFEEREEDDFGLSSAPAEPSDYNIMSRFNAKKGA